MKKFLLACSVLCAASPAFADDAVMEPGIVVIATRNPTPAAEIGSSATVVDADEIAAKQEQSLPDVLRDMPGLNVVQNGGQGGVASVFMRGANANHTKVFVDGIDMSDPSAPTGAFDFATISAADIEQVEVLRGPQSGLYGSDAIGGVVNVITKKGTGPAQFTASAEAGSYATFNQAAGVSGSQGRFNYAFNVDHLHSGASPTTPINLLAPGESHHDDDHDSQTASTKLGAELTDTLDVGLVARYTKTDAQFTADDDLPPYSTPDAVQSESRDKEFFTRATIHQKLFDNYDHTLGLAYSSYDREDFIPGEDPEFNYGDRYKLDYQGNVTLGAGETGTLGAEHQVDAIHDSPISAHNNNDAAFLQLQSSMGDFFNALSLRFDDNEKFGGYPTWRIAPAYLFSDTGTRLKASYGTGFKAPTLNQLFVSLPAFNFFANPNLQPEKSEGYDLGFEQTVFNKKVQFGSTYFHNDIQNLIAPNAGFTTDINIASATTQGFESFITYKPLNTLTLRADHTFTLAEDNNTHEELLRRPKNKASLNADWQASKKWEFTGTLLYVGPWVDGNRDFTIPRLTTSGYTTLNLTANYALTEAVTLYGRVDNLLDKRYEEPEGFLQEGLGAYGGVKTRF